MNDSETDAAANATAKSHLGFRLAVGAVGLALLALFVLLGSVTMKHSATSQALESQGSPREEAQSAPARE